jgi:probable HAF family extracellular repeat protein
MKAVRHPCRFLTVLLFSWASFSDSFATATLYRVTNLGVAPGTVASSARAVNDNRQVTGYLVTTGGAITAFYYDSGVMMNAGTLPGGSFAVGSSINAAGTAVGYSNSSMQNRGIAFSDATLNSIGIPPSGSFSQASAINNLGEIGGMAGFPSGDHPFVLSGGVWTDLGLLLGDTFGSVVGMNDVGQRVGESNHIALGGVLVQHAVLWSGGAMTDLSPLLPGINASARAVNLSGEILINTTQNTGDQAYLYDGSTLTHLGSLLGSNSAVSNDINDSGQIVGRSAGRAFIYENSSMADLNTMLDSSGIGWTLHEAFGINNRGDIVGAGTFAGLSRAYLLTPVPEPASVVPALIAMTGYVFWKRRVR